MIYTGGTLSRTGSVRSFNTAYGGNQSRPHSPGADSGGYEVWYGILYSMVWYKVWYGQTALARG